MEFHILMIVYYATKCDQRLGHKKVIIIDSTKRGEMGGT